MNVLVTGGTGFIGKQIIQLLLEEGNAVINLTTQRNQGRVISPTFQHVYWNPTTKELDTAVLPEINAVIHLAGYSVANKWNAVNKELMVSSRISSTTFLCEILNNLKHTPQVFIGASASGFYNNSDKTQDESASAGTGFLSELTKSWEEASQTLSPSIKKIHLRIGVVLSAKDGALKKLTPIFKAGIGSPVGNGKQFMSWVHEEDLTRLFVHCIKNDVPSGIYNATSHTPVTNSEFSQTLASVLKKPYFFPNIPSFILKMLFGEMSQLVLVSQKLNNAKVLATKFDFKFKTIRAALEAIYGKN